MGHVTGFRVGPENTSNLTSLRPRDGAYHLAKVPAWQLALDIIDLFCILLLLVVAHAAAIVLHLVIVIYHLQYPCPHLA